MKKSINTVYLENDLSVFKTLHGNRTVDDDRVSRIIKSIESVGMINAPIVVNERMEVIDGQGRLEACRRLGRPIPYIIIPRLGVEECLSMNINQKNWTTIDYVRSYADRGNRNYRRLLDFFEASGFSFTVATWILFRGDSSNAIKCGRIIVTETDLDKATDLAVYLHKFDGIETNRRFTFYMGIAHAIEIDGVSKHTLEQKIFKSPRAFVSLSNLNDCMKVIETVYNKSRRSQFIYIETEFRKKMALHGDSKNPDVG